VEVLRGKSCARRHSLRLMRRADSFGLVKGRAEDQRLDPLGFIGSNFNFRCSESGWKIIGM